MDNLSFIFEKLQHIPDQLVKFTPSVLLALIIFIVGRIIVRRASKTAATSVQKLPNIDETLGRFLGSLILFIGMFIVIVMALSAMKVNMAFIASMLAALMVALGFALKDSLGDFASGVMLALFTPFKVGEDVEVAGERGVVVDTGLLTTRLVTRDNIEINVGNGAVFGGTIKNYSEDGKLRLDMDVGVAYDADLNKSIKTLVTAAKKDTRVYADPAPWAKVTALGDSAVNLQLRVWTDAEDHRKVKMELSKYIKDALDKAGIEIPYEHVTIIKRA
ncbi:MAG: mechanosensitive ion channel family protein [Maricaulaceae bacterium]